MKRTSAALSFRFAVALAAGCGSGTDLTKASTQRQFGVRMARMNLWREAMFRFKRAVEINPEDALAHNNLAVALEANGDFDAAAKEYREAMRLDKTNEHIQKNYSRFVEFTSRNKKRQQQQTQQKPMLSDAPTQPDASQRTPPNIEPAPAPPPQPQPQGVSR